MWFLSFWVWVMPLNIKLSRFVHLSQISFFFNIWVIYQLLYRPHSHYPLIYWLTPRLIPFPGCCKYSSNKHGTAGFSLVGYEVLWVFIFRAYHSPILNFLRTISTHTPGSDSRAPPSLHPCQYLGSLFLWCEPFWLGWEWTIKVVLICISLLIKDV